MKLEDPQQSLPSSELIAHFEQFADAIAIIEQTGYGTELWTYRQLSRLSMQVAARFRDLVTHKDRVGCLISKPTAHWIAVLTALLWQGKEVCVLPANLPKRQLIEAKRCLRWEVAVADRPLEHSFAALMLDELFDAAGQRSYFHSESKAEAATIVRTSGSCGISKFVVLRLANHWYNALGAYTTIPFSAGKRWLMSLPLYHVSGLSLLFRAWLRGGTLVVGVDWENIGYSNENFHYLSLVPMQLYRLLQDTKAVEQLQRAEAILLGGAAAAPALLRQAWELEIPIRTTYGLTETASQVTTLPYTHTFEQLLSAGVVLPYRSVRIEDGEIYVRGKVLAQGYVDTDGTLQKLPQRDGWFATGDRGQMDDNGFLYVQGRKDTMFLSAGMKIYPEEIERVLLEFPDVVRACVVPLEDPQYGARPVAFVQWVNKDRALPAEVVQQYLRQQLESYKVPDYIVPLPVAFQRQMKLPRRQLQAYAEQLLRS